MEEKKKVSSQTFHCVILEKFSEGGKKTLHLKQSVVCLQGFSGILVCCTCRGLFSFFPETFIVHDMKHLGLTKGMCPEKGTETVGVSFYATVKSVKSSL